MTKKLVSSEPARARRLRRRMATKTYGQRLRPQSTSIVAPPRQSGYPQPRVTSLILGEGERWLVNWRCFSSHHGLPEAARTPSSFNQGWAQFYRTEMSLQNTRRSVVQSAAHPWLNEDGVRPGSSHAPQRQRGPPAGNPRPAPLRISDVARGCGYSPCRGGATFDVDGALNVVRRSWLPYAGAAAVRVPVRN